MSTGLSLFIQALLSIAGFCITFMPRWLELRLGPALGYGYYYANSRRRKIAYDNIRRCLPELGPEGWNRTLKENYAHYGVLAFELMHMFSPFKNHYYQYCSKNTVVDDLENWRRAHQKGKGVLFVASHLANWELMSAGGALAGIPLTIVTKHLKPEWLHKKIESARLSVGVKGTYEPRTLPAIMRALRNKESVGFVLDQYAGPPIGIPVKFFGVKVGTLAAVGTLVARTGASVVPARTYRDAKGVVHICMLPEMDLSTLQTENLEEKVTETLAGLVEQWVRQTPPQWLWTHRRFKNVVWPSELT